MLGKRSQLKDPSSNSKSKKAKKEISNSALTIDESNVFRPCAHISPSDVKFVSSDKMAAFALHSFVLKMRSPVLAAILECSRDDEEPISLPDSGPSLRIFFESLYSNDPQKLLTAKNIVPLCELANKYGCTELLARGLDCARRLVKISKLSSGTVPSIPQLLLLAQDTNSSILSNAIITEDMKYFKLSTTPTAAGTYCKIHRGEPLPCYHRTAQCGAPVVELMDDEGRKTLAKLNPSTLVKIMEAIMSRPTVGVRGY